MKLTKKILALMLALAMLLALTACGAKESAEDKLEDSMDALEDSLEALEDSLDDLEGSTGTPGDVSTEDAPAEASGDFQRGAVSGSTYTSDYIGIGLDLPAGWTYFDDAQIAEISGLTQDAIDNETVNASLENGTVVFDMYAMDGTGHSINICIENLGVLYGTVLDEDGYFDIAESNLAPSLESMGAANVVVERDAATVAGKEHTAVYVSCDMNGVEFYEQIVAIKCGNYMALITSAGTDPDTVLSMMSSFYAL